MSRPETSDVETRKAPRGRSTEHDLRVKSVPEGTGADFFPLTAYRARVRYRVGGAAGGLGVPVDPSGGPGFWSGQNADVILTIRVTEEMGGVLVRSSVTALKDGVVLDRIEPLALRDRVTGGDVSVFRNGWQSWSGTSSFAWGEPVPAERRTLFIHEVGRSPALAAGTERDCSFSDLCVGIESASGPSAIVLGYLGGASQFGGFEIDARESSLRRVSAVLSFDGALLRAGEARAGEPLLILRGREAVPLLERHASLLGEAMAARVPERSPVGWCSWYHYFTAIDEDSIVANLAAVVAARETLPVTLFQIDDGYQAAVGDWLTPNAKFPGGMRAMAQRIRSEGLTAGLWVAPFIAQRGSALLREHPDWFIQTRDGKPRRALFNPAWNTWSTAKALDLTHPAVQVWLADVFRTMAHEWGYKFLKLDFLFAAALPGERFDPRRTGAEALRKGLEIIRESVGPAVHLLGCGCPLGAAVGLVDSMRIGPDVAPHWTDWKARFLTGDYGVLPSTRAALRNVTSRAFMHGRLWQNDADCILVRDQRTKLNLNEVRALASLAALSGGAVLVSDDFTTLAPSRAEIAETAVRMSRDVQGATPRCLDLMTSRFPRLLWTPRARGGGYLTLFNPDDTDQDFDVDFTRHAPLDALGARVRARDAWTGQESHVTGGTLAVRAVPPHAVHVLLLEPAEPAGA